MRRAGSFFARALAAALLIVLARTVAAAEFIPSVPDDFPRFIVPGREPEMDSLRRLYYLHYLPGGPLATLWDDWLSGSTLWPAVETDGRMETIRRRWRDALAAREMDAEGYVATHQHASIAHQQGWPFPSWEQGGPDSWGWHFAVPAPIYAGGSIKPRGTEGWEIDGGRDAGMDAEGWKLALESPDAVLRSPPLNFDTFNAPFIQIRWRASGLEDAAPSLRWTVVGAPDIAGNEFHFDTIAAGQGIHFTMIPVYKSPRWTGRIARLELRLGNRAPAQVTVQAMFTQYDTRHTINQQNFIRGCCRYFAWTRDLGFLRGQIQRVRLAARYMLDELGVAENHCIRAPWIGHDGRSGIEIGPDGKKNILRGRGVGGNYWDLLPMGGRDAYATIHCYDALKHLARLEAEIAGHPEWNIPDGPLRIEAPQINQLADKIKQQSGGMFWNEATGRFVCAIDEDGRAHDYGFTFLNLEAVASGYTTEAQGRSILDWVSGVRGVEGDTSTGSDIYHWRFAPRATTKRNIDYYFWGWSAPESIPFGGQVQDGGAVLGFSYHDLMARLAVNGPDDAWKRLSEIIAWFDEVAAAGGYREYYKDPAKGSLQGGGTAGGLGLDQEFFESILVPQVMLDGFLGLIPGGDTLSVSPRLPAAWPELTVTRIHYHEHVLDIRADANSVTVTRRSPPGAPVRLLISGQPRELAAEAESADFAIQPNSN